MEKVTGIGGVFLKARDAAALAEWYEKHLGVPFGKGLYVSFKWDNVPDPAKPGSTVFSFFKQETKYFEPSTAPFMINFRVKDLDALLSELRASGVEVIGDAQSFDYGKFGWCVDPEGNKIELWEPIDG